MSSMLSKNHVKYQDVAAYLRGYDRNTPESAEDWSKQQSAAFEPGMLMFCLEKVGAPTGLTVGRSDNQDSYRVRDLCIVVGKDNGRALVVNITASAYELRFLEVLMFEKARKAILEEKDFLYVAVKPAQPITESKSHEIEQVGAIYAQGGSRRSLVVDANGPQEPAMALLSTLGANLIPPGSVKQVLDIGNVCQMLFAAEGRQDDPNKALVKTCFSPIANTERLGNEVLPTQPPPAVWQEPMPTSDVEVPASVQGLLSNAPSTIPAPEPAAWGIPAGFEGQSTAEPSGFQAGGQSSSPFGDSTPFQELKQAPPVDFAQRFKQDAAVGSTAAEAPLPTVSRSDFQEELAHPTEFEQHFQPQPYFEASPAKSPLPPGKEEELKQAYEQLMQAAGSAMSSTEASTEPASPLDQDLSFFSEQSTRAPSREFISSPDQVKPPSPVGEAAQAPQQYLDTIFNAKSDGGSQTPPPLDGGSPTSPQLDGGLQSPQPLNSGTPVSLEKHSADGLDSATKSVAGPDSEAKPTTGPKKDPDLFNRLYAQLAKGPATAEGAPVAPPVTPFVGQEVAPLAEPVANVQPTVDQSASPVAATQPPGNWQWTEPQSPNEMTGATNANAPGQFEPQPSPPASPFEELPSPPGSPMPQPKESLSSTSFPSLEEMSAAAVSGDQGAKPVQEDEPSWWREAAKEALSAPTSADSAATGTTTAKSEFAVEPAKSWAGGEPQSTLGQNDTRSTEQLESAPLARALAENSLPKADSGAAPVTSAGSAAMSVPDPWQMSPPKSLDTESPQTVSPETWGLAQTPEREPAAQWVSESAKQEPVTAASTSPLPGGTQSSSVVTPLPSTGAQSSTAITPFPPTGTQSSSAVTPVPATGTKSSSSITPLPSTGTQSSSAVTPLPGTSSQFSASPTPFPATGIQSSPPVTPLPSTGAQSSASFAPLPAAGTQSSSAVTPLPAAGTQSSSAVTPLPAAGTQSSSAVTPLPAAGTQSSSAVTPLPAAGTQSSSAVTPLPAVGTQSSNAVTPLPAVGTQSSNAVTPLPAAGTQSSSAITPLPAAGTQSSSAVTPLPAAGTQSSSSVTPLPAAGTQSSSSVAPLPAPGTQSSSSVTPLPAAGTQSSSSVTPLPAAGTQSSSSVAPLLAPGTQSSSSVTPLPAAGTQSSGAVTPLPATGTQSSSSVAPLSNPKSESPFATTGTQSSRHANPASASSPLALGTESSATINPLASQAPSLTGSAGSSPRAARERGSGTPATPEPASKEAPSIQLDHPYKGLPEAASGLIEEKSPATVQPHSVPQTSSLRFDEGEQPAIRAAAESQAATTSSASDFAAKEPGDLSLDSASAANLSTPNKSRQQQDPRLVMNEMVLLMNKLEQQVSQAAKRLGARAELIKQRLNKQVEDLVQVAAQVEKDNQASTTDLSARLSKSLDEFSEEVRQHISDVAANGRYTIKQLLNSNQIQLEEKQNALHDALKATCNRFRIDTESFTREADIALTNTVKAKSADLEQMISAISEHLDDTNEQFVLKLNARFVRFKERMDEEAMSVSRSLERNVHSMFEEIDGSWDRASEKLKSSKNEFDQTILHTVKTAKLTSSQNTKQILIDSLSPLLRDRRNRLQEQIEELTKRFEEESTSQAAEQLQGLESSLTAARHQLQTLVSECMDNIDSVGRGQQAGLEDIFKVTSTHTEKVTSDVQTSIDRAHTQIVEAEAACKRLAENSNLDADGELTEERNTTNASIQHTKQHSHSALQNTIEDSCTKLEQLSQRVQSELSTERMEQTQAVREAAENGLARIREAVQEAYNAVQAAREKYME
jgi:hypothetical protein